MCRKRKEKMKKISKKKGFAFPVGGEKYREIKVGGSKTIFTVGYERRSGEDLIAALRDAGVKILIDVRDKPISRKPDFRESALRALCEDARIRYETWKDLGSTVEQREKLKSSGDFGKFETAFRKYAERELSEPIDRLAKLVQKASETVAMICYERCHEECHRSIIADMLFAKYKIGIT